MLVSLVYRDADNKLPQALYKINIDIQLAMPFIIIRKI